MNFLRRWSLNIPTQNYALALALCVCFFSSSGHGAITSVGGTYMTGTWTNASVTEPAGSMQNDILIVYLAVNTINTAFVPDAGWTLLYSLPSATQADVWVYWMRRGAGAASGMFSWTTSADYAVSITGWRGVKSLGSPFNITASNARVQRLSTLGPDCPAVTTTVANTMVIALGMAWNGWNFSGTSTPTGYTLIHEQATMGQLGIAYKSLAAAGAEDPSSFGPTNSASKDVAEITVALEPAPAGAPSRIRHRVIND